MNGLFLFIALARMVTFCKEGDGRLSVWALRARSHKTRAEACHQGIAHYPPQRIFPVFVLHLAGHDPFNPLIRGKNSLHTVINIMKNLRIGLILYF